MQRTFVVVTALVAWCFVAGGLASVRAEATGFVEQNTQLSLSSKHGASPLNEADILERYISSSQSFQPKEGFVPDGATAVGIAEAVLIPVYGKKTIEAEYPLIAMPRGDSWIVSGSLPKGKVGGTAIVKISKQTGAIEFMIHGQ